MQTTADYLALPVVPADRRVAYGLHADQFADLYLPAGDGPHPALVLLHGGCWRAEYGLSPLGRLCDALRGMGIAVWNMEYRRLGGGGGWPTTFADVAAGADALAGVAAEHAIDLGRVLVAGHSAGGHLALWLAARRRLPAGSPLFRPEPLALAGVVGIAGLADLAAGVARGLCGGACAEIVGGLPRERPERYAQGSPAALLPLGVPQRHIVGADDAIVPPDYLRDYVERAVAAGDDATLQVIAGAGHFEPADPSSAAWPLLSRTIAELLGRES
jgi:acetyl esterase/lipase